MIYFIPKDLPKGLQYVFNLILLDHSYQVHLAYGGVQYINGGIHQLLNSIEIHVEKSDFHVMSLRSTSVILCYPWFFSTLYSMCQTFV